MNRTHPLGQTRTRVRRDHALIGIDSHVPCPLVDWEHTEGVVLISPAMNANGRGPGFCQTLAKLTPQSRTSAAADGVQRLIVVLEGRIKLDGESLSTESFAYTPAGWTGELTTDDDATLLVFEKRYRPRVGFQTPAALTGTFASSPSAPFLGDPDAILTTLLPDDPSFDMAVNVFTYQSGAALPFVETHVMEHGLYMSAGQGVYRLADDWYPVTHGDSIWMAAYCPQWFVAMGGQPAQYIYYKDVHRSPLT